MKKVKTIISRLKNNTFWKSVIVLASGTALAQFLGVFTTPIVSRLYDPQAYGEYAIIWSTATIITTLVTLGLTSAVMVPVSDEESREVFTVAFWTMLFLATVVLAVMLIVSPFFHFFKPGISYTVACILVYGFVIVNGLGGLLRVYVNRKGLNRVLFYNSLIGALATLCITIPLGFLNIGSLGLVTASIIAGIVSNVQMLYHTKPFKKWLPLQCFKKVYIKYKDFILYQHPSNFVANLASQMPTQIFSAVFGNANLGSYSMNEKILGIPSRLIGTPINTVYFRTASEYNKEGKNLAEFTFSLVTKVMAIAFIPITVAVFWGEQLFVWVLGPSWSEAGKFAGFLIVQYVFMFCTNCTSYCRVAIGRQKVNFVISILRLVIISLSVFMGAFLSGDLFYTIIFFAVGSSLYLIIDMTMNFYCMGKYWTKYLIFALIYFFVIIILWFLAGKLN